MCGLEQWSAYMGGGMWYPHLVAGSTARGDVPMLQMALQTPANIVPSSSSRLTTSIATIATVAVETGLWSVTISG